MSSPPRPRRLRHHFAHLVPLLFGKFDNENRVLGRNTDQELKADLGVDVVVETAQQGKVQCAIGLQCTDIIDHPCGQKASKTATATLP